ncbi:hypothetical protein GCM10007877_09860 [Marinibactrum halimedae]|uniref:Uncharacterized protein n=1 Tax=Marinibactrum halimedae TaxID=1444977 RepID=A0AA37T9U4_9GAMM|nr:hypothetical protein GCM10007877_09860 [Marinibactrum halimedae]
MVDYYVVLLSQVAHAILLSTTLFTDDPITEDIAPFSEQIREFTCNIDASTHVFGATMVVHTYSSPYDVFGDIEYVFKGHVSADESKEKIRIVGM